MKTMPECFPCFLEQSLRVAALVGCSDEKRLRVMLEVSSLLSAMDPLVSPPENAIMLYECLHRLLGTDDPYNAVKMMENDRALVVIDSLRAEVAAAENPLFAAVSFAIAGNIIDYGAASTFDSAATLAASREACFAIDHRARLASSLERLPTGAAVLYLCDNCGEIVYDTLLVELLARRDLAVTVTVRGGPIINDALLADAGRAGMNRFAKVITNGVACPGSALAQCSAEFCRQFFEADMVIAKGQGNFETLSEVDREVFFLLTVKCKVVARHLNSLLHGGTQVTGSGEMVILHHPG